MAKERNRGTASREIPVKEVSHFSHNDQQVRHRIAQKAFELYERRVFCLGCDLEDWIEAERLVLAEMESQTAKPDPNDDETEREGRD